ncbi:hypothetical protein [uncultured Flavobacterium sp.]|uniref:hypothetical protein n=1 Tax=uncultured Flavobacterium sp. TaxID=165435 RepID=UPI0025D7E6E9|nr:hypothetical protein [uncultured Flavobacterium sp.]
MREVEQIYYNEFGVAFHWKKNNEVLKDKVQLVFRETGFYFTYREIRDFALIIDETFDELKCCSGCQRRCHKFLLRTPLRQIDLAVNRRELKQIKDLVEGTLFMIGLYGYLENEGRN